ncbi:T-cell surface glycoprotein CD8 alpha chain-like isoform X1 [Kryptolebias marmoratus]|uniref:T-cell surface glycoprotein CD8 alpha chain-like isoform X1 n=1 Tax=Kryptolebias marmoratus TaxID=37003 RepID=UPI0018ACB607|nr:T-cell surface glycoprotein CD8 alpha chain-like isoform X1 [Kryptolebias marmoratus]
MDGLHMTLVVLLGVVFCAHTSISLLVLEETVRPGDNITLYCDCKVSTGVYIVWFRNCSHENQPTLLLHLIKSYEWDKRFPRFKCEKNDSSNSYDLVIINTTKSDEGLYYCGTEEQKVEKDEIITSKIIYTYSNITTRLTVNSSGLHGDVKSAPQDCAVCWKLLFSLCPAVSVLSALLSSLLVYLLCQKTAQKSQDDKKRHDTVRQTEETQGEDVCYTTLEIRSASQRPKKMRTVQSSDFSTYSAINTDQM